MQLVVNPPRQRWNELTQRNIPDDRHIEDSVRAILDDVRKNGDTALYALSEQYDHAKLDTLTLSQDDIDAGIAQTDTSLLEAIGKAIQNIKLFHAAQLPAPVEVETAPGVRCLQKAVPIRRVGIYIPGGRAPLFSTVLMLAVPAAIAGCKEVALFTPKTNGQIAPAILAAAHMCGINEIHPVGGAQAIAAMAYGTESITRVDKIFGPGNRYVTKAKQIVSALTAIDMPAGPSEVMVMADKTAIPAYCAADMLSQAEHGPDSQAILVCDNLQTAKEVIREVEIQKAGLSRRESVEGSLSHSRIIVLESRKDMCDFANAYGAEHLILSVEDPWQKAQEITAAGSVFIGNYSPESVGDYASGTNHTLPTSGWAKAMSGVNIDSFMHKITYQQLTPAGLQNLSQTVMTMAEAEGLEAHANAVKIRLK